MAKYLYPKNSIELKEWSQFEKYKYEKILPILAARLNQVHELNESKLFWEQVLGRFLLIHIAQCHYFHKRNDIQQNNFQDFQLKQIDNENQHRSLFVESDYGQNLFSNIYHNKPLEKLKYCNPIQSEPKTLSNRLSLIKSKGIIFLIQKVIEKILSIMIKPNTLLFEVYWKDSSRFNIQLKSMGKAQFVKLPLVENYTKRDIDKKARFVISKTDKTFDQFDKLFFRSLEYSLPSSLIENFKKRLNVISDFLKKYNFVKNFLNESMSPDAMLLIALAKKQGFNTYYIEHNFLQHQFIGNIIWYIKRKFDYYLSMGWNVLNDQNHIPLSSNYDWHRPLKVKQKYRLLYISTISVNKMANTTSSYGESGYYFSKMYDKLRKEFFTNLNEDILEKIYFRAYPKSRQYNYYMPERNIDFENWIKNKVAYYDDYDTSNFNQLMRQSGLCICDYLSTPYNQLLIANVPSIILMNSKTYLLENEFKNIFSKLIDAKIVFLDPSEAALFINENIENINEWWKSKHVQSARKDYLQTNFGKPNKLNDFILKIAR